MQQPESVPGASARSHNRTLDKFLHPSLSLLLLAAAFLLLVGLPSRDLDFPLTDGAFYFEKARQLAPDRQWSPLFVVFYALFHKLLAGQPMAIYLAHRIVVLAITALLFWLISRRLFPGGAALLLTLVLLANAVLLENLFVVHTASLAGFLLLLFYLVLYPGRDWGLLGLALCGTLVRPEFLPVLLVAAAIVALKFFRNKLRKPGGFDLALAAACGVVFLFVWTKSDTPPGYDRSFDAFSQRSGWAALRRSGESPRSGHIGHLERTRQVYGPVSSIPQAILANPAAFTEHLAYNLAELPREIVLTFLPRGAHWSSFLIWALVAIGLASAGPPRRAPPAFWVLVSAFAAGGVGVCLLLEPRTVYLIPILPLAYWGVAELLARSGGNKTSKPGWIQTWAPYGLGIVLVLVPGGAPIRGPAGQPVLECAAHLERAKFDPVKLYAFSGLSYCTFLASVGKDCLAEHPGVPSPSSNLVTLLEAGGLNAVIIDDFLRQLYRDSPSNALVDFEQDPAKWGFRLAHSTHGRPLGDTRLYLLGQ